MKIYYVIMNTHERWFVITCSCDHVILLFPTYVHIPDGELDNIQPNTPGTPNHVYN